MDKKELIERLNNERKAVTEEKPHQRKVQREGGLQIACVRWFRLQYPKFSKLLFHPKNEADGTYGKKIAINAAAGVVPGVPDLILALPSNKNIKLKSEGIKILEGFNGLGIELKYGKTNNQTDHQKRFQAHWEAAGYKYSLCRSLEDFMEVVNEYMEDVPIEVKEKVKNLQLEDINEHNKEVLRKICGKEVKK